MLLQPGKIFFSMAGSPLKARLNCAVLEDVTVLFECEPE